MGGQRLALAREEMCESSSKNHAELHLNIRHLIYVYANDYDYKRKIVNASE